MSFIVSLLLKFGFGGIVDKYLSHLEAKADTQTERQRIKTQERIASIKAAQTNHAEQQQTARANAKEGTERQKAKMNYTVFWFIIVAALGPGIFNLWGIVIYNYFFWENGVWPQDWSIAEFPPQAAVWVDLSMKWLFDPIGLPATVATATGAGYATRK